MMADRTAMSHSALCVGLLALSITGLVAACVHEERVTTRPRYAFPQHMTSLCGKDARLLVSNRGEFVTADRTSAGNALLLSVQLSGASLDTQRLITRLELDVTANKGMSVYALDGEQRWQLGHFPAENLLCDDSGELLLDFPSDSFYFWASVGTRQRLLALWTNASGDVVIQNRWREEHTGLVSGTATGDAWAIFKASEPPAATGSSADSLAATRIETDATSCGDLTGRYLPDAEVVHADGSLDSRPAAEQFFREELAGVQALPPDTAPATELRVAQGNDHGVMLSLYDGVTLLGSRSLPAKSLTCREGRWQFKGEKMMHSAWLLFAASGGYHWEDLALWRDRTGALLVEGRHTQRALLMLVPFGGTQTLFMAFPALEQAVTEPCSTPNECATAGAGQPGTE